MNSAKMRAIENSMEIKGKEIPSDGLESDVPDKSESSIKMDKVSNSFMIGAILVFIIHLIMVIAIIIPSVYLDWP